jgi:hypothetical protein
VLVLARRFLDTAAAPFAEDTAAPVSMMNEDVSRYLQADGGDAEVSFN